MAMPLVLSFASEGWQTCDDSNTDGNDGCGPTCLRETCGDGT
jgi:hypothetical protein